MNAAVRFGAEACRKTYRTVFWRLMPVLMLCYILNYLDRSNIGLAKLAFMKDLGMPETAYGFAGGAFYLGYISLGVPVNIALGRIGARASLLLIMLSWGLFSALLAFIVTPLHFYILRFLIGVSETGFLPAVLLYLSHWVPGSQRARFNGIFLAAIAIAGLIGGPLGGYILSHDNGVFGPESLAASVPARRPARLRHGCGGVLLSEREAWRRALAGCGAKRSDPAEISSRRPQAGATHGTLWQALGDRRFWALVAIAMAGSIGTSGIGLWLPTIINQTGVTDLMAIGLLSAIPYAAAIVIQFLNARHSDQHRGTALACRRSPDDRGRWLVRDAGSRPRSLGFDRGHDTGGVCDFRFHRPILVDADRHALGDGGRGRPWLYHHHAGARVFC